MREPETLVAFKNGYDAIFGKQWPIWIGGILFGMINVFMFAFERPWSSANGISETGETGFLTVWKSGHHHFISLSSFFNFPFEFWNHRRSFCFSFVKQFQVRMAPTRELFKGLLGGTLMGIGSALSFGCATSEVFFSATSALSLAGPAMMIGLIVGSFLGLKLLVWEITYLSPVLKICFFLPRSYFRQIHNNLSFVPSLSR